MQGIFEIKREQVTFIINGCNVESVRVLDGKLEFFPIGEDVSVWTFRVGEPGLIEIDYMFNCTGNADEHADRRIWDIVEEFNTKHCEAKRGLK